MPSAIYELIVLPQATQGEEPGVRTPVAHCSSAPPDRDANRHASTMLKNIMMSNEASCRSCAGGARGVATASSGMVEACSMPQQGSMLRAAAYACRSPGMDTSRQIGRTFDIMLARVTAADGIFQEHDDTA